MKAKINFNWGTGIAAFYSLFAIAILLFVVFSFRQKIDLVSPDYYAKELAYQEQIDAMQRNKALPEQIGLKLNAQVLELKIPQSLQQRQISGEVELFCPSDKTKDLKFAFEVYGLAKKSIDLKQIKPGHYTLKLSWIDEGNSYYHEETLFIP